MQEHVSTKYTLAVLSAGVEFDVPIRVIQGNPLTSMIRDYLASFNY